MTNQINLPIPIPIIDGGTNSSSQTMSGINFFDGTKITSNSSYTYNGSSTIIAYNPAGSISSTLERNAATDAANLIFADQQAGTNLWSIGLNPGGNSLHFFGSSEVMTLDLTGNVTITNLTASRLTGTNGSNQLVSGNLTGDVTSAAFATTLATVNSNTGTFGSATQVGSFTVNGKGLITAANNITITGVAPGGAAGGDLSGTYPDPAVAKINGVALGSATATGGNLLIGSGTQWVTNALSGDATLTAAGVLTIANNAITTVKILNNNVTYAKFQQVTASRLLGNPTGGTANVSEISLGAALTFSGTALQTLAMTGDITTAANSFATTLATVNGNVGTFGSATQVGSFTVNAKGLITAASNITITGVTPGGAAGGDLTGTYPNPTIAANAITYAKFQQVAALSVVGNSTNALANALDITAASDNQVLRRSGTAIGFGSLNLSQANTVGVSVLPIANGGTNATSANYVNNGVIAYNGTRLVSLTGLTGTAGQLTELNTTAGATAIIRVNNSDNTDTGSNSIFSAVSGGTSGGDPFTRYTIVGSVDWAAGLDNSDSGSYVISSSVSPGTSNRLRIDTSGNVSIVAGDLTATAGNLIVSTATKGYQQKAAAVSAAAANSTLVTGVVLTSGASGTITNTAVTTSHIGFATCTTSSGTQTFTRITCNSGSFSLAANALDNGTYAILFVKAN